MQGVGCMGRRLGKSFYRQLVLLSLLMLAVVAAALALSLSALSAARVETESTLRSILELEAHTIQSSRTSNVDADTAQKLGESVELAAVISQGFAGYGEQCRALEELLAQTEAANADSDKDLYFYFADEGVLLGSRPGAGDIAANAPDFLLEGIETLDLSNVGFSKKRLGTTEEGSYYDVYLMVVQPGVCYVRVKWGKPSYGLPDSLLQSFPDAEMYSYDLYGNEHVLSESAELSGCFTYQSLGEEPDGMLSTEREGRCYLGAYCTFESGGTRMAIFIHDTQREAQKAIIGFLVCAFSLLAVIVLAAIAVVSWRSYRPWRSLALRLGGDGQKGDRAVLDDPVAVGLLVESDRAALAEQRALLERRWFMSLLHGAPDAQLEQYAGPWWSGEAEAWYCLVYLWPDGDGVVAGEGVACASGRRGGPGEGAVIGGLVETGAATVAQGVSRAGYRLLSEAGPAEAFIAVLLDGACDGRGSDIDGGWGQGAAARVYELVRELADDEACGAQAQVRVGVSGAHRGAEGLHECWNEVLAVRECSRHIKMSGRVCPYAAVEGLLSTGQLPVSVHAMARILADHIAALRVEKALEHFDAIALRIVSQGGDPSLYETSFRYLAKTVAYAVSGFTLPADVSPAALRKVAARADTAQDAAELRAALMEAFELVGGASCDAATSCERFEQAKCIVQERFRDADFSADALARQLGMSASGVSRLFKRHTHAGFVDYLRRLRVEEATHLLVETDLTEDRVAEAVGYTNVTTMIRAFKAQTGHTPHEVRSARR